MSVHVPVMGHSPNENGDTSRRDTRDLSSDTGFLSLGTVTCGARCFLWWGPSWALQDTQQRPLPRHPGLYPLDAM